VFYAAPTALLTSTAAQRFRHKKKQKKLFAMSHVTAPVVNDSIPARVLSL